MHRRLFAVCLAAGFALTSWSAETWRPAEDEQVVRTGTWTPARHRYAADSAVATTQEGAALEFRFRGQALVLVLDTLTPPNNYGPPELGLLEVSVDGVTRALVRPREAAGEVVVFRSDVNETHVARIVHRADRGGVGARIRGFRVTDEPGGDLAFTVSGEQNGALRDVRAIVRRHGRVVRDTLVRNGLNGACRIAALPPGAGYTLEIRATGWQPFLTEKLEVGAGRETTLPAVFLRRVFVVEQDEFTFPSFGYAAVRRPGEAFRARFEAPHDEVRGVRLVRRYGRATIHRNCGFEEDRAAAFYYHREGSLTIPADTPPGTYDLEIALSSGGRSRTIVSPRSVTVVAAFPAEPVFVSWGHLDTWGQYQAEYVEQLVAVANLLAPDMVLVSNEANPAYAAGALHGLEMPFVINFGNHRGPDPGPWFGEPVGSIDFGREFTVVNFGRAWDRSHAEAERLLAERRDTRIRILNAYEANAPVDLLDRHAIPLIHYAHGPGPAVAKLGATPTIRVGKSNSESFRVIRFKDGRLATYTYRGHATAPIPFPRGGNPPLGIRFLEANDGTAPRQAAEFHNDLEEGFPAARAVFVMPAGEYGASGARIERTVTSDDGMFSLVVARFDLPARSRGRIEVAPRPAAP